MEPKFQSSFIPKGPNASVASSIQERPTIKTSFLGVLAFGVFVISLLLAMGALGYRLYLERDISKMGEALSTAESTLDPEAIDDLVRLNNRIISTESLLQSHVAVSAFLDFLEDSTLQAVRFTELEYNHTHEGISLGMVGEARSYASLALQADIFSKDPTFVSQSFSELSLDDVGNVTFMYKAKVDPSAVSYERLVGDVLLPPLESEEVDGTTASSTEDQVEPLGDSSDTGANNI